MTGDTMNPRRHGLPHLLGPRWLTVLLTAAVLGVAFSGCPPPVVRSKVPDQDIIKANEAARDADLAFARKDFYSALIKYLEASRLNPNSEFIFNKLGIAYSQLKYYAEAVTAFQRSIELNPKYPFSYNNLGTVYFAKDDKKKAEKYFKKAIGINGNIASFHVNLGTLYFEKKKFDKGMAEWRKGLAIDPAALNRTEGISLAAATGRAQSMDRSYSMARLYAAMGDADRALDNLQQAVNAGFTDIEAIRKEADFDPIRNDEKFIEFMKTLVLLTRK